MIWPGIGMNYGHQAPHNPYDSTQVTTDLTFLKSVGVTKLRIAFPTFDSSSLAAIQALVQQALSMGFYVIWGVTTGGPGTTATRWAAFKNFVIGTLIPWFQLQANARLECSLGNEEELHCDGTTLTVSTVIQDISSLAATAKQQYTYGPVSYQSPGGFFTQWQTNGVGTLDRLGFNYYNLAAKGLQASAAGVATAFPNVGYISEWGTPGGFLDFPNEALWHDVLGAQVAALATVGIDAYYFCYRDGSFGMPANKWAIKLTDDNFRVAAPALFGIRAWFSGNPNVGVARNPAPLRADTPIRANSLARAAY